MSIDDYLDNVIELLKEGKPEILYTAARCVLYCSEEGLEYADLIDAVLEERGMGGYE